MKEKWRYRNDIRWARRFFRSPQAGFVASLNTRQCTKHRCPSARWHRFRCACFQCSRHKKICWHRHSMWNVHGTRFDKDANLWLIAKSSWDGFIICLYNSCVSSWSMSISIPWNILKICDNVSSRAKWAMLQQISQTPIAALDASEGSHQKLCSVTTVFDQCHEHPAAQLSAQ